MTEPFASLARYNLWATRRLYTHVDALSESDYRGDCGLFFHTVHGTLNHLLVASELIWYPRFAQGVSPQAVQLSDEVEPDRARLRQRLNTSCERWIELVSGFSPDLYQGRISYTTMRGTQVVLPFGATLLHVFNHATHHRGQITAALTARGQACPEIDLVYMLQAEQAAS